MVEAQLAQQTQVEAQAQALSLPKKLLSAAKGTKGGTRGCLHSCCSLPKGLKGNRRSRRYSRRALDNDKEDERPQAAAAVAATGQAGARTSGGAHQSSDKRQPSGPANELELDDIEAGAVRAQPAGSLRQRQPSQASSAKAEQQQTATGSAPSTSKRPTD